MRFGLNTFLVSSGFCDAELDLVRTFKNWGADLIELAVVDPAAISIADLQLHLEAEDLSRPVICGAFSAGRNLRGSEAEKAASVAYLSDLIDLASGLGSKVVCGPMYSETGLTQAYSDAEREAQMQQIAKALKPLCEKAEAAGIVLAVEPLNRFETDCINTLSQAVDLIERVGSPALKIHIDTFHMHIEEDDSVAAILRYGEYIGHVHASASHRGLLGKDQIDWAGVIRALQEVDYGGDIVIESFSRHNKAIAKATSIWRDLYESPDQLATKGLSFLREQWACSSALVR